MSADSSLARQASATQPLLQVPGTPPAGQRPSSNLPKRASQGLRATVLHVSPHTAIKIPRLVQPFAPTVLTVILTKFR